MSISKVGTYAFYNHPNLERAVVSAPVIEANAFQNATKLEAVDLTSDAAVSIAENAFNGCSVMKHLVIRSLTRSILENTSALSAGDFKRHIGGIYVPSDLLDSYKSATNWTTLKRCFYPIEEYPKAHFDTIEDSWSDILSNQSYNTDYVIGDNKIIKISDGTQFYMRIAALDVDEKSDDSGKAKITWVSSFSSKSAASGSSYANASWDEATNSLRSYLQNNIWPLIPNNIKNHIVPVKKCTHLKSGTNVWTDDYIWPLSYRERFGTQDVEDEGPIYDAFFNDSEKSWLPATCWLRSEATNDRNYAIAQGAAVTSYNASTKLSIIFGFCTD